MNQKKLRDIVFYLHRYIGLIAGLVMVIVGFTGSLLVFEQEFDHFVITQQYGQIIPQQKQLSPESVVNTIKAARSNFQLYRLYLPDAPDAPYLGQLVSTDNAGIEVFINPYTGVIMGERQSNTLISLILQLHYTLLAGETGIIVVGITALLMCILSITGLILWPGWRKLIAGIKIKWNAHPKRLNFDIHKVVGIISVVFLLLNAFTGFCWNFNSFTEPIIYAVTLTQKPSDPVSKVIPGKSTLGLTEQLKIADAALPGAITKSIYFPSQPENVLQIRFKLPQENSEYGESNVYLDQYTGKVLRVDNSLKMPLGDRVLNSFTPLHYGTFGGLSTRIIYVFVGLSPSILFITGFVMYRHRYQEKSIRHKPIV